MIVVLLSDIRHVKINIDSIDEDESPTDKKSNELPMNKIIRIMNKHMDLYTSLVAGWCFWHRGLNCPLRVTDRQRRRASGNNRTSMPLIRDGVRSKLAHKAPA